MSATPPPTPSPISERGNAVGKESENPARWWKTSSELWDKLKPLAREMRHTPTAAENKLWQALRRHQLDGLQFRRQQAFDRFIVDFYCSMAKLVIEVVGPIHERTAEEDALRQELLEGLGLTVLRFSNDAVLRGIDTVLDQIRIAATRSQRRTSPSPKSGRGTEGEGF